MAITWNSITLKALVSGPTNPGISSGNISEIPLLPDPANLAKKASVIQQGPTLGDQVKYKCYVSSMADYNTLKGHKKSGTIGTLSDGDQINASYVISDLGPPNFVQSNYIDFDLTLLEV